MALTLTKVTGAPYDIGARWQSIYTAAGDNSYATGGYALKPTDLGFAATSDPDWLIETAGGVGGQYTTSYDYTNQKLVFYVGVGVYTATFDPASLASVTSRDDAITVTGIASTDEVVRVEPPAAILASVVVQGARVTGTNTVTVRLTNPSAGAVDVASGTWKFYVAAANGAPHEVPSATDLTGVTGIKIIATGRYRG